MTSRALNMQVTLTLSPSSRNWVALRTPTSRSCSAMRGLIFIPLTSCCLLFLSLPSLLSLYLCLPKSMIRQTGGCAEGLTMTKSRPCSRARLRAARLNMMPSCPPSSSMTRISRWRRTRLLISGPGSGRGGLLNPGIFVSPGLRRQGDRPCIIASVVCGTRAISHIGPIRPIRQPPSTWSVRSWV